MSGVAIFSFFSGAGFLDLGFESVFGESIVSASEINPHFIRAYHEGRASLGLRVTEGLFIGDYESAAREVSGRFADMRGRIRIFVGGPPCPDFSVAGKNAGESGENGRLTRSYFEEISKYKPEYFVFENVKGIVSNSKHKAFFDEMLKSVSDSYVLYFEVMNSLSFGVAQDRERVIVVGVRADLSKKPVSIPVQYSGAYIKSLDWPTVGRFDGQLTGLQAALTVSSAWEAAKVHNHPNQISAFKPRAGASRFEAKLEGDTSGKSFKRLHRHRYSPTVAYGNNEVHIHPYEPRRISVAEALALQSLPGAYSLPLDMPLSWMFKTIGNGVPYKMAEAIAAAIDEHIKAL